MMNLALVALQMNSINASVPSWVWQGLFGFTIIVVPILLAWSTAREQNRQTGGNSGTIIFIIIIIVMAVVYTKAGMTPMCGQGISC